MDGPPPPPPPGPPPPPAPAPAKVGGGDAGPGNRGALLSSIENFKKGGLKKAVTVDKSAPATTSKPSGGGGGAPMGGGGGGGGGTMGRGAPIAGFNPFAQGMPQLKKTGRGGGIYVSPGSQVASPKPKPLAPQQPAQPQKTSPRPGQPGANQLKQEEENRKRQEEERKRREEDERRRRENEKAEQERRIQEEERRRREVERKERDRIEEERRRQDEERRRQEEERSRHEEERRRERERAEQERIEQRKRADRDREEEERQRQQRIENEKRKREEKRREEERKDAEYRKQLEEAKAQAELRRKQEAAQKEESWKMHQKEREEKKRLSGSLQLSGSGSVFTTLLQQPSPQQSPQPQHPQQNQSTDRLISNFENIISYQPDQLNVKEIGEELVRLVNAAKEIASRTQNPEKLARITHLLQGLVLETKDFLVKVKENSPALYSSKAQLVKTLKTLALALNEPDEPLSPVLRSPGGTHIVQSPSSSSHFASVPEANRAARRLELFLSSLDQPTPRHQIDPGQLGQGIKSANTHLSKAVLVFNTLNNHLSVEERRRNFQYEDFASHIVKFGEEIIHTSGWTGDSEIRNSLISATRTIANATHGVICTLDMNGEVAQSREVWTKVVAATVNVLKQVLTLAAQHKI